MRDLIKSGDRGNALVLAVFILLAITSVGVLSVQRTSTDLQVAGNIARAAQANAAGSACITSAIKQVEKRFLDDKREKLEAVRFRATHPNEPPLENPTYLQFSTSLADPDANKAFFRSTVGGDDPIARIGQDMACAVRWYRIKEIRNRGGYQVDDICNQVIGLDGIGGIPSAPITFIDPDSGVDIRTDEGLDLTTEIAHQRETVMVRNRASIVVGPTPCDIK